ncbi:hypothetical protein TRIUR3_13446 [Triticum urartu]|uniref:Uncharacterized protein n=1 Tax=Triticum urartu TaxID=4572 RepID=M8AIC4_TRIUA|nr:hypothetical protein TRIUR3_13446 [Triticum urartu]
MAAMLAEADDNHSRANKGPVPESRSWKAEAGGGAQAALLLLLVSAGRSTDGGQLAGSGAPVPESRSWKAQAGGGGARAALLLVGAGRSMGGAKARSRGRRDGQESRAAGGCGGWRGSCVQVWALDWSGGRKVADEELRPARTDAGGAAVGWSLAEGRSDGVR